MRGFVAGRAIAVLALLGCERPSPHVYSSPPPRGAAVPVAPTMPELPIGSIGPGARIVAISDAVTGAPVALGSLTDSIDVLTLVAFGPATNASRDGGRVELVLRGSPMDTTLALHLDVPAPSVVAHVFRVAGLKVGRYTVVVRLRTSGGQVLAETIPLYMEVVAH